jgi:proteasome lid subunit RPN8/RPN11
MTRTLIVPRATLTAMRRHVQRRAPLEACGLLAGRNGRVELVVGVRNTARSPVRYLMDPRQQWNAFEKFEQLGLELLGIYHSHPNGPSRPSPTDIEETLYEAVQIIWWRQGEPWQADGFWIADGKVSKVTLHIDP